MEKHIKSPTYTTLVLSGGGMKGFAQIGALQYYQSIGKLDNINTYIGVSIGSIISYCLCIGYTPMECISNACTHYNVISDVKNDDSNINSTNLLNLITKFGLLTFDVLAEIVTSFDKITKLKYPHLHKPTLYELFIATGKKLVIVTYNLTKKQTEYLTYLTDPDLSVMDAIKMSCNIPLVFENIVYKQSYYIDGGILDNIPLKYAVNNTVGKILAVFTCWTYPEIKPPKSVDKLILDKCLDNDLFKAAVNLTTDISTILNKSIQKNDLTQESTNNHFIGYLMAIMVAPMQTSEQQSMKWKNNEKIDLVTIDVDNLGLDLMSMKINSKDLTILFTNGFEASKSMYKKKYKFIKKEKLD